MAQAPYPGLAPELWDLVAELADDPNPLPEHLRSIEHMREAILAVEAKRPPVSPEVFTLDDTFFDETRQVQCRVYRPKSSESSTLMVYFHGGGWSLGGLDGHDAVCADIALQTGLTVVSVDYALAPENPYPAALEDCLLVVRAIRDTGEAEIWLGGDSAGANLALGAALRLRDAGEPTPNGLLLFYPALDPACDAPSHTTHADAPYLSTKSMRRHWADYLGTAPPDAYAAPIMADLTSLPPTIIQTVELDPLVDEGDALAHALRDAGVEVWHEQIKGMIHGFVRFRNLSPIADAAFRRATAALKKRLV